MRITEHFVFQGVEGAEAAAELRVAVSRFGLWVGFGGFWWVLGGFWSLKATTLKSLKFIVKNSVLGSGGCMVG